MKLTNILFLFSVALFATRAYADDADTYKLTATAAAKCESILSDKRLDPVRGLVEIYDKAEVKPATQIDRYPTPKEQKVLKLLIELKKQCDAEFLAISPDWGNGKLDGEDSISMLSKLTRADFTYAYYATWLKKFRDSINAKYEKKTLDCVAEKPASIAGMEFYVSFNEGMKTVSASGRGILQNAQIDDAHIYYERLDKDGYSVWRTSISRGSGAY